jgi:glycosyltransferase involved in cell wall biosynthesis
MTKDKLALSVVIPIYNEEENVAPLLAELMPILEGLKLGFEVLCVNDASTDRSLELLTEMQSIYPSLWVISHSINSGESAATATGFQQASGEFIVTMDGDLQNDPADIPALLERITENHLAAVCGIRRKREDDWVKRLSSRTANAFRNLITGDKIADAGCTFRILRRESLREIPVFNGMHRFLPTMLRFQGFTVEELLVNHRPRTMGVSKYGVGNRLFRGIIDCFAMRWWQRRCLPTRRY